ncbi:hypothetical protein EMCRGX_G013405 [Ephydatia muelleri]
MVPSTDRWNTSKQHKARTIEDIESCAGNSRESYSVKYCPLLSIDLDHVVPDELHWFLRVMDVQLENVALQAVQLDVKVNKSMQIHSRGQCSRNDQVAWQYETIQLPRCS